MKKQNIIKLVSIVILSLIILFIVSNMSKNTNYVSFDYIVESIDYRENGMYLTFLDDESKEQIESSINIEYVIYQKDVNIDSLSEIVVGDLVNITVEDNYGTFKYTIIYKMKHNDNVLFNIMEEYSNLDKNNAIVFVSAISCIIIYLIVLCIYKEKNRNNTVTDFVIKNPLWKKYFFIGAIIVALGFILPFSLLFASGNCDFDYFAFSFAFYIIGIAGCFGVYVCIKEKFTFQKETFTYHKIFGKVLSVKVSQIKHICLILNQFKKLYKVEFYDYNGKIILSFYDHGRAFVDNLFLSACNLYKIPIKVRLKNKKNKKI